jgi:hypothetical protein
VSAMVVGGECCLVVGVDGRSLKVESGMESGRHDG